MTLARISLTIVAAMALAACPATSVKPPAAPTPPKAPESPPALRSPDLSATRYAVDSARTVVHIHVLRGGALARFGHNHVITSKHVTGLVWTHSVLERSGFDLQFPVAQLIVDDTDARAANGAEFSGEIAAADRDATRTNMLRTEVLDAQQHPTIRLQALRVRGSRASPIITTRITIRGVAREVLVPASVVVDGDQLTASGEFELMQTEFGIEPFSVGFGALEVQDRLRVRFGIVARRGETDRSAGR